MAVSALLEKIQKTPTEITFEEVIACINDNYQYKATQFSNGKTINEQGTNEGSCKIFAFAQLNNLTPAQTLACFGRFYREDVLANPTGTDHANIRNFMQYGWSGISFNKPALTLK